MGKLITLLHIGICVVFCRVSHAIKPYSVCLQTPVAITDARGKITSPGYPNQYASHLDCKWRITSHSDIKLTLEHLDNADVYDTGTFCYDYLRFAYIGERGTRTFIDSDGELCAKDVSELKRTEFIVSKGSQDTVTVEISFTSDYSHAGTGFSLSFDTLCNQTQRGESGVVTSLNYPKNYPNLANCFTEIQGPEGSSIEIEFSSINFSNIGDCKSDYLVINAGPPGAYGFKRTRYCKDTTRILIASSVVTLQLVTDISFTSTGFSANWRAVLPTTAASTTPSLTTTTPTETTVSTTTTPQTSAVTTPYVAISNCSYTIGGFICQRWDVEMPHKPTILPSVNDRGHNYCRNPENTNGGPWCYTTDPRKEYDFCEVNKCIQSTTILQSSNPQFTTRPDTDVTKQVFLRGNETDAAKATSDEPRTVLWYPILAVLALLFIFAIGVFFWCRGKKRKSIVTISEPSASDVVVFQNFPYDDYRPRENTYVEIPFLDEVREDHTTRVNREEQVGGCAKSFVRLDNAGSNSSTESIDSILRAKEAARRNFQRGASTSNDTNAYSVADDVERNRAGPSLPRPREGDHNQITVTESQAVNLQNVYQAIEAQAANENETEYQMPVSTPSVRTSTKSSDVSEHSSKKWEFWKKKSTQKTNGGFSNPTYRKESSIDCDSLGKNPFEDDGSTSESPVQQLSPENEERTEFMEDIDVYHAPSVIPREKPSESPHSKIELCASVTAHTPDSPYMMPKLSIREKIPDDAAMISISPNMIDDSDHMTSGVGLQTFRSVTDPMSPTFDRTEDFIYDAPQQRSATQSFASVKSDTSATTENSEFHSNSRDSGNASLSNVGQYDEKSNEYCIMGEVDKITPLQTGSLNPNQMNFNSSNRASQLYLSMRGFEEVERKDGDSSITGPSDIARTTL